MTYRAMSGLSLGTFLVTVGAILYFAVTAEIEGFDVNTAGVILMVIGFLVAFVSLLWVLTEGARPRTRYVESRREAPASPTREPPREIVREEERRSVDDRIV